jgi:hypothetical protein
MTTVGSLPHQKSLYHRSVLWSCSRQQSCFTIEDNNGNMKGIRKKTDLGFYKKFFITRGRVVIQIIITINIFSLHEKCSIHR